MKTATLQPYAKHVLICAHGDYEPPQTGEQIKTYIESRLGDLTAPENPARVLVNQIDCTGLCQSEPMLAIYPDGVWYHDLSNEVLDRILIEHVIGGYPALEHAFYHLHPEEATEEFTPDSSAPETSTERRKRQKKGLVIVNTGNGKGKTTASLGLMLRAWGRNMRVSVLQFLKNENARYGEIRAAEKLGIEITPTGDGFTWKSKDIDETVARARHGWALAQERISSDEYDVIVLDEFTYPLHFGWLDVDEVITWLREHKPPMLHVVITGRYAPPQLVAFADLVTEMRKIKHAHDQGISAQPGVEF